MNNKIIIKGKRLLGGSRFFYKNIDNSFITETIETSEQLENFINNLSSENFDYESDESWIDENDSYKIYKGYTKNKKESVIQTIRTIFNKLAVACYVQIRNNKITKFVHLTNLEFRNNWEKSGDIIVENNYSNIRKKLLEKTNMSKDRLKYELNFEEDSSKWTANGCLIGTWKNPTYHGFKRLFVYYNLIKLALENTSNINCDFIMNRRDFPIIKSDNSHPYNINNDRNFYEYTPIPSFSSCVTKDFADFAIPTRDDWDITIGSNKRHRDNFKWKNKIEKAVWRGNGTNCGITINDNQRLKLHQMKDDYKEFMNVGIIGWNPRDKFDKETKKVGLINVSDFKPLVDHLDYSQQFQYKYHLNLDGHVAAFRLGYLLSQNILVLQVESDNGWYLWYQEKLIPHDIYNNNPNNNKSHYILVKKDLSNLVEIIKWCRKNDETVKKIVNRATQYFYNNLTRKYLIKRFESLIKKI